MRIISISLAAALTFLSCSGKAEGNVFDIESTLATRQVLIIGWDHVDGNPVPDLLANELPPGAFNLTLLTEDSFGYPLYQIEHLPSVARLVEAAHAKGIPVEGADHPSIYEFGEAAKLRLFDTSVPKLVRVLSAFDRPKISFYERSVYMAGVIEHFVGQGRKVIFLVGKNHLRQLAVLLKQKQISFTSRATNLDYASLAVTLEGKVIAQAQDAWHIRFLQSLNQAKAGQISPTVHSLTWDGYVPRTLTEKLSDKAARCSSFLKGRNYTRGEIQLY